jgi:alkylation response protein AidB-like acyl-CoA dehydrogenase
MIDFELTEEQRQMHDLAHRFAAKEIRPIAPEADEREEVPYDLLCKAAQTGLTSYFIPEKYGGGGADHLTHILVSEEIAWGCAGVGTILGANALCATPILVGGNEDQKAIILERFASTDRPYLGAFALTEPSAGSDVSSIITEARRDGSSYVLYGYKHFITNAGIADLYVVFATTDISLGVRGLTAFVVEKGARGLVSEGKEKKLGIRASHTATLVFEDVRIPVENRLGEEGEGFTIAMKTFEFTRSHIAAMSVGLARAAYEYALQYAKERIQFGKPVIQNQGISFMLAEMAMNIDAARLLTWRAARLADQGRPCALEASMAKAFAADMAMKVTTDAVQVLGGYGYSREYPVEKWMRDAKIMQIYEGTSQIQRLIISRAIAEA